jgi:hypothetical protein
MVPAERTVFASVTFLHLSYFTAADASIFREMYAADFVYVHSASFSDI